MPLEADIFTSRAGGRDGMISIYSANPERQQRFIAREFIDQKVDTSLSFSVKAGFDEALCSTFLLHFQ